MMSVEMRAVDRFKRHTLRDYTWEMREKEEQGVNRRFLT